MDYSIFSEIDISTSCNERFLIYWRLADCYENGERFMKERQVIQYTTGTRLLPITYDVILRFIKLEKGSRLHLVTEEYWPLGNIKEVPFYSDGNICSISCRK